VLLATVLVLGSVFSTSGAAAPTDYLFTNQSVVYGASADESNRNAADSSYQSITETDSASDTNYSASSEDITYGTAGGGSFPTALNTDDGTRRSYTEENTGGGAPPGDIFYLYPDGDILADWNTVYPSGSHYAAVDDAIEGGDGGSTYVETSTGNDIDRFSLDDLGDPGAGYEIDIQLFAVYYKGASQPCDFTCGIRIGTTNYQAYSTNPSNGAYTNTSSTTWQTNPDTSSEWTYSNIDGLVVYITTSDASPAVRCTQIGVKVWVNYSASDNYELDAEITFSSVTSTANTISYSVICQGYRTDASEDFGIYAWDYVATDWNLKDTIDQTSDFDFDFALTSDERDGTGNEVLIRILGLTESSDSTQNVVYLDVLKVNRLERLYAASVEMDTDSTISASAAELVVKGYTSDGETWTCDIYNHTTLGWETMFSITDLSNTEHKDDINMTHHVDAGEVTIRFDNQGSPDTTTASEYYLDYVCIRTANPIPVITNDPGDPTVYTETYWEYDFDYTDDDSCSWEVETNATFLDINGSTGLLNGTTDTTEAWYFVIVYCNDTYGGSDSLEFTFTVELALVEENDPPEITATPTYWQPVAEFYSFYAEAEDPDDDALVWALGGTAIWLYVDENAGWVNGTPYAVGMYEVNLTVFDGEYYDYLNFTIHVYLPTTTGLSEGELLFLGILVSCILGIGLFALSVVQSSQILALFSGLVFMFSSMTVFAELNPGWAVVTFCLGFLLVFYGASALDESQQGYI